MQKRMIVDVQTHIVVPLWAEALINAGVIELSGSQVVFRWRGISHTQSDEFVDIEKQMKVCSEAGITHRMIHTPMILTFINEVLGTPVMEVARIHNDFMAELQQQHPGILFPYGTIKPHEGRDAIREAERCIDKLGFKALAIDTSYGTTDRVFNHVVETFDFWEFANERQIPVYIHPAFLCYGWEWMDRYKFDETVARPNETGLNISLMLISGLFDRFPKLKIILAHMGGSFMMILPRLQFGHKLGYDKLYGYQKALNKREPMEYVWENIWVDTMGFDPAGIKHAIEVFGIDHVLFGTDYGPVPFSPREHIDIICNDLGLSIQDQNKILGLNAQTLFELPDPCN